MHAADDSALMFRPFPWIVVLLLPTASAFSIELTLPEERLVPVQDVREGTVQVTATCEEVWERSPPPLESTMFVDIHHTGPDSGIGISGPGTVAMDTSSCTTPLEGTVETTATYSFSAFARTPALTPLPVTFTALLAETQFAQEAMTEDSGTLEVEYKGTLDLAVDRPIQVMSVDQEAVFTLTVTNLGNAPTVVHFSLEEDPPAGYRIELPEDTVVPSHVTEHPSVDLPLLASVEDIGRREVLPLADFRLVVESWAETEPGLTGPTLTQPFSLRVDDPKGAPAPAPVLVLPILVATALLARRRP